ncbi:hypothetical protein A2U01_0061805, partial [Trifolium medium]|nr:hypothetical protein [Trifolium medium]
SKSRTAPKIALSMSDLYLSENSFKSSNVESDVTASGTSKSAANDDASASTKADDNPTVDSVQKVLSETHAEQDVTPSGQTSDKPV